MVTAELAVAMPAVVVVLALSLWAFGLGVDQVRCVDAARAAARAAARGDSASQATALAVRAAPQGASVEVTVTADSAIVSVTAPVRGIGSWMPAPFRPAGTATAAREVPGPVPTMGAVP